MVAYSFQPQFIDPTLSGRKIHTIRAEGRRRHARPGEALQHYVGMRTKHCRLFARSTCLQILPICIDFLRMYPGDTVRIGEKLQMWGTDLDAFALNDGFAAWTQMRTFWAKHHPNVLQFRGLIIYWK